MKGIIFNLLEQAVCRTHGDDSWDDLLDAAHLRGAYTSVGSYPDEDLTKLVTAAVQSFQMPADEIVRWFGREALPLLAEKHPNFFAGHSSTRSFLMTLNDIIHPEVRKIYPGAMVPQFDYDTTSSQRVLVIGYRSTRLLCALAAGLIDGAAAHYGETVRVEQSQCTKREDPVCEFRITFHAAEA